MVAGLAVPTSKEKIREQPSWWLSREARCMQRVARPSIAHEWTVCKLSHLLTWCRIHASEFSRCAGLC